jgi:hypothetical protein
MHNSERWQLHGDVDAIRKQFLLQDNTTKTNLSLLRITQSTPLLEDVISKMVVLRRIIL